MSASVYDSFSRYRTTTTIGELFQHKKTPNRTSKQALLPEARKHFDVTYFAALFIGSRPAQVQKNLEGLLQKRLRNKDGDLFHPLQPDRSFCPPGGVSVLVKGTVTFSSFPKLCVPAGSPSRGGDVTVYV